MPKDGRQSQQRIRWADPRLFVGRPLLEVARGVGGSGGRIRTYDQRINSPLRYRCATPECRTERGL